MAETNSGFAAAEQRVSMQNRTAMRYTDMSNRFMNGGRAYPPQRNNMSAVRPNTGVTAAAVNSTADNIPTEAIHSDDTSGNKCTVEKEVGKSGSSSCGAMQRAGDPITAVRSFLASADTEKLIITALIILLASEGADMILIAALVYILMP